MLYNMLEVQRTMMLPLNIGARVSRDVFASAMNPLAYTQMGRKLAAGFELMERMTRQYKQPDFGITETKIGNKKFEITEEFIKEKTFCSLLHFKKSGAPKQPKMLVVAPMSGHFATLLRGTVEGLLPHFDVYITEWHDVRNIPISKGDFDLDDYIDYTIEFLHDLGKGVNVMAVCQPSVPVMAAVSIMSDEKDPYVPATMTLIGGPIDTRISPTEVNILAETKPLSWFEKNVICHVPMNYKGHMREVYPGFLQLTGFMTMNMDSHMGAHINLFNHLVEGDGDGVDTHKKFYNEYLAVMDLSAEFYLQTIKTVFQEHSLPKGTMTSRGRKVKPEKITKTALLTIEGERDDISGRGQTKAAMTLCKGLSAAQKKYYLQKSVGHYGSFNGRRYREYIVPVMKDFVTKHGNAR